MHVKGTIFGRTYVPVKSTFDEGIKVNFIICCTEIFSVIFLKYMIPQKVTVGYGNITGRVVEVQNVSFRSVPINLIFFLMNSILAVHIPPYRNYHSLYLKLQAYRSKFDRKQKSQVKVKCKNILSVLRSDICLCCPCKRVYI